MRRAGIGERTFSKDSEPPHSAPTHERRKRRQRDGDTSRVHGARRYEVLWDGVSATDRIASLAGEHHVVIRRGGRAAWSGWISALASGTFDVWVPDADPCSSEDLAGVSLGAGGAPVVPSGVRCDAWAVAAPGSNRGTLQLALCRGD